MKLFIAVAFFCLGEECYFWKSSDNFYSAQECSKSLQEFISKFEDTTPVFGNCLVVNLKNNI
jgi:hypothetical protein